MSADRVRAEPTVARWRRCGAKRPDVLMTDIRMPGRERSRSCWTQIRAKRAASCPVIVMTAHSDLDSAVAAYQGGAFEYLPKPFDIDQAVDLVRRAARQRHALRTSGDRAQPHSGMLGQAPAMQEVFRAIGRLSRSSMTVLITGESGTGKELVARALHRHSPRAAKPFIALNTSAIHRGPAGVGTVRPREGRVHRRGSSCGAGASSRPTAARCSSTRSATCRRALQTRLLRVLAEGEFYRVGGQTAGARRRARDRGDAPGPRRARAVRAVPRGPAASSERDTHRGAAAACAPRTFRSCCITISSVAAIELGAEPKVLTPEAASAHCRTSAGQATCVSSVRRVPTPDGDSRPAARSRSQTFRPDLGGVPGTAKLQDEWTRQLTQWAEKQARWPARRRCSTMRCRSSSGP